MTSATLAEYESSWRSASEDTAWHCLFVLPFWLKAVQTHLASDSEALILTVADGNGTIGHLPLALDGGTARFLGIPDVCDYQDVVARPGYAAGVVAAAVDFLRARGVARLDLQTLRPDALALQGLEALARKDAIGLEVLVSDVTYETALPSQWDDYLMRLSGKQRHEVRRKIRRLAYSGAFRYRRAGSGAQLGRGIDIFLDLFQRNRRDKADFMSAGMSAYFRDIMTGLDRLQMLRLYFLEVEQVPAATVLCFDYGGVRYLYNSGYDDRFQHLSVGALSKIFSIQTAIEDGCRHYDFLRGRETYKRRIGGEETELYRCKVEL